MTESVISRLSSVGRVPEDIRRSAAQQQRFDTENTQRSVGYVMLDCSGTTMDRYVDAPAIVFVHGLSGCWQNWLENIPHFARGHRVLALDLPGFGFSPVPNSPGR